MSARGVTRKARAARRPAAQVSSPVHRMRELARRAEALDFEFVAFDLFFAVVRLEETGRASEVRRELAETATSVGGSGARFYWRAVRLLGTGDVSTST